MHEKIVTIIVPAYNSEWCLEICLSSLAVEEVLDDIQVIVVNDGSTDKTGIIADEYAVRYPNSFSVIHKDNGGHGSCINAAVIQATGKYLKVVDSDDWLINLDVYISALKNTEADVVINNFETVSAVTKKKVTYKTKGFVCGKLYSINEIPNRNNECLVCFNFHGITYKTDTYLRSKTVLLEKVFYEDQQYATQPFSSVKNFIILDFILYQYLVDNASQSVADANQVKRLWHQELVIKTLFEYYSINKEEFSEGTRRYFIYKLSKCLLAYYTTSMIKNPDKAGGRRDAKALRDIIEHKESEIVGLVRKNFLIISVLNYMRLNSSLLSLLHDSTMYWWLKKILKH